MQEHFVERVRAAEEAGNAARAALKTKADAERYVEEVRKKIRLCFGPFPEKTPLAPRVTGTVDRDAYTLEKVIFESRPKFFVTANLYVPKGRKTPMPGVYLCGACTHPGGSVIGINGRNAAMEVLGMPSRVSVAPTAPARTPSAATAPAG